MSPLCRAAASLVRLVGCCLAGLAAVLFALAWLKMPPWWQLALNAVLLIAGLALLVHSQALAARLTGEADGNNPPDRGD